MTPRPKLTESDRVIARIRKTDPVRADFIEELRQMVDLWQDEFSRLEDEREKLEEILNCGYRMLEAFEISPL